MEITSSSVWETSGVCRRKIFMLRLLLLITPINGLWLGDCDKALGMESGDIPHEAIFASSSHDHAVGPHNARVRTDNRGGAWCPKGHMMPGERQYLEIDLGRIFVITATGTQGRYGNGGGQEYTELYRLEYWRPGFQDFVPFVDTFGNQTLPGNNNTVLEVRNQLHPPLVARKIRFVPFITHPRTICLRVEIYGCNHTTGLLNYSVPDGGTTKSPGFLFQDRAYEVAKLRGGILKGGLGLLYDGEVGSPLTNFKSKEYGKGKVLEWVGWSKKLLKKSPLEILFYFDTMRNFSSFVFHTFSAPDDGIVLPTKAEIYFSEDGDTFHEKPLRSTFKSSPPKIPTQRNTSMSLQNRPGKVLKVIFHFPEGWFVISEVYFDSEPCACNLSDWWPNEASAPAERTADREDTRDVSTVSAIHSHTHTYMGIVIGFIIGVFLLVASGLLIYVRKLRKQKTSPHVLKSPLSDSSSIAFDMRSLRLATSYSGAGASMYGPVSVPDEDGSMYHEPYKTPLFSASEYSVATIGRQFNEYAEGMTPGTNRKGQMTGEYAVPILSTPPASFNQTTKTPFGTLNKTTFNTSAKAAYNSTNNNAPYTTTPISAPSTPFSQIPVTGASHSESTQFSTCNGGMSTGTLPKNETFPSLIRLCPAPSLPVPLSSNKYVTSSSDVYVSPSTDKYVATSSDNYVIPSTDNYATSPTDNYEVPPTISKELNILSPFGTALHRLDSGGTNLRTRNPRELPRQAVHLAEKLGDGDFGTVYVGEVINPNDSGDNNTTAALTTTGRKVVVATLHQDCPGDKRDIAWKQAQLLASLQDPNIECLLGVVSRDDPLFLVMEFPALGDLNQYLRRHVPDTTTPRLNHMRAISYGSLIYLATQIASGMKYLESQKIIHNDLATRNILVAPGQLVKIGSIGSCRSLYAGDYYRYPTGDPPSPLRIPLRWMSWEALFLGKLSSKSDVWSFGVTLWEILTLGRTQPFERMSDDGIIDYLAHFYHDDNEKIYLPQPATCPKEIYDMLLECWRKTPADRPNFRDIHIFLQRKNHGYAPDL